MPDALSDWGYRDKQDKIPVHVELTVSPKDRQLTYNGMGEGGKKEKEQPLLHQ